MAKYITINNHLYKLKAKDYKRLEQSTQQEKIGFRGNKIQRFTTEETEAIILDIETRYKSIGEVSGSF